MKFLSIILFFFICQCAKPKPYINPRLKFCVRRVLKSFHDNIRDKKRLEFDCQINLLIVRDSTPQVRRIYIAEESNKACEYYLPFDSLTVPPLPTNYKEKDSLKIGLQIPKN